MPTLSTSSAVVLPRFFQDSNVLIDTAGEVFETASRLRRDFATYQLSAIWGDRNQVVTTVLKLLGHGDYIVLAKGPNPDQYKDLNVEILFAARVGVLVGQASDEEELILQLAPLVQKEHYSRRVIVDFGLFSV